MKMKMYVILFTFILAFSTINSTKIVKFRDAVQDTKDFIQGMVLQRDVSQIKDKKNKCSDLVDTMFQKSIDIVTQFTKLNKDIQADAGFLTITNDILEIIQLFVDVVQKTINWKTTIDPYCGVSALYENIKTFKKDFVDQNNITKYVMTPIHLAFAFNDIYEGIKKKNWSRCGNGTGYLLFILFKWHTK